MRSWSTLVRKKQILGGGNEPLPRIAFVDHVARLSGGEIALLRLLSATQGLISPHVILGEEGPLVDRLREIDVSVEVLPLSGLVRDLRKQTVRPSQLRLSSAARTLPYVLSLRQRLREIRVDAVHTNSLKAAVYGGAAGRLAGVPVIWHVRDRIADDYLPPSAVRLIRTTARFLPTEIIANSNTTLATLGKRHRGQVLYDPLGFDPALQQHSQAPRRTERHLMIGVVGRLAEWKGQHIFLDAFAQAFRDEPVVARLIGSAMFGEDAYEEGLRRQVQRLGIADQVEFLGFREDIWKELADLDVLVHCSIMAEPFGQVVIEGMAAGLPVIAAAAGGPSEVITNEVDGLLTPSGDKKLLALALRRLADEPDLRSRLGSRAQLTSRRFAPARAAEQLLEIYRSALPKLVSNS
jgi:glycosyltransferase involved in cell wall biosynthesis